MLKVITSLFVLMITFNNQIIAFECNFSKFQKTLGELIASQYSDETKRKELARYSVCDDPIKNYYNQLVFSYKYIFIYTNERKSYE